MAYQQSHQYHDQRDVSPIQPQDSMIPPPPPPHRDPVGTQPDSPYGQGQRQYQDANDYSDYSHTSPIAGNFQDHAANMNAPGAPRGVPPPGPFSDNYAYDSPTPPRPIHSPYNNSNPHLASGAIGPAGMYSSASSMHSSQHSAPLTSQQPLPYSDSPYTRYSSSNLDLAPQLGAINPNELADDDDWGMTTNTQTKRRSFVPFSREGPPGTASGAAAAGVAAGGAAAAAGSVSRDGSGNYDAVPTAENAAPSPGRGEKSEWLESQNHGRKKLMWIVIAVIALVVVGAVVGGVLGTALNKHGGGSAGSAGSESGGKNGANVVAEDNKDDLTINSAEIKELMNNKNLHKVFPGMDYTPLNSQYPDCMHNPASQNNITRDMAVMSQLTNSVRLYGNDCNQTEMVLHAMDRLQLKDMKLWLGVWLGNNDTTNERQVSTFWEIVDKHITPKLEKKEEHPFKGVIVGNEVLYRKDLTKTELLKYITDIKSNLSKIADKAGADSAKLPIALADLGNNWTEDMANKVDVVMANVHPFFTGKKIEEAAGWTWSFWTDHDVKLTKNDPSIKQIIAEVGWPTGGGNSCGADDCATKDQGSVASIDNLNSFMEDWVCPSMKNGTDYFWFSAFDEPWKIQYNEKGKEWEDKWGLMDVNRNLKKGVTIPDCSGQTVS